MLDVAVAHRAVLAQQSLLRVERSELKPSSSLHVMPDSVALSSLFAFQKIAAACCGRPDASVLGSVDGKLVFSISSRPREPARSCKKRGRDTTQEEAARAVARVRKSGESADCVAETTFEAAEKVLGGLLRLRGAQGEPPLESWGLALRADGKHGTKIDSPNLVASARLAAGVAIGMRELVDALRPCVDGLVTVDSEKLRSDFDLPKTEQSLAAAVAGQKSVLLLVTIPARLDSPENGEQHKVG